MGNEELKMNYRVLELKMNFGIFCSQIKQKNNNQKNSFTKPTPPHSISSQMQSKPSHRAAIYGTARVYYIKVLK